MAMRTVWLAWASPAYVVGCVSLFPWSSCNAILFNVERMLGCTLMSSLDSWPGANILD
ncbi:hypothetical protein BDW71DRAFT_175348 [Aspergillus fruticulosus]